MYSSIKKISYLIRTFILVLPSISIFGVHPLLVNIIFEPVLHLITFLTTGIFIRSGDTPTLGSINYFLNYCLFILLLYFSDWITQFVNIHIFIIFFISSIIYIFFYVKVINSILYPSDF